MDLTLSFITGIASAVAYSAIQAAYSYFRWVRTKNYFIGEIRGVMSLVSYHFANVLDIDTIYNEFGEDVLMSEKEFIEQVISMPITEKQYKQLNHILRNIHKNIQTFRKEALSVPIFSAPDFHAVDNFLRSLNDFLSFYSWVDDELQDQKTDQHLKERLAKILQNSDKNPFRGNLFDRFLKWYRLKYFYTKKNITKHRKKKSTDINSIELPF